MAYCARCSGSGYLPQRVGRRMIRNRCRTCMYDNLAEQLYLAMIEATMGKAAKSPHLAWNLLPSAVIDGWRHVQATAMTMER